MDHRDEASTTRVRRWVLGTWLGLAACVCAAALVSSPWPRSALTAGMLMLPLLLPLRGLLAGTRRTHAWATLCLVPYFIYGATETIANPAVRNLAGAILFACLAHFVALVAFLRVTRRPAAQAPAAP